MKEIELLIKNYQQDAENIPAALATVVRVEGSSYRRIGARMLIYENGTWKGGISGGCLERDVLKRAKRVIQKQEATTITYDTTNDDANQIGVGLGCNGIIDILISPLKKDSLYNPLEVLKACVESRQSNLLVSVIENTTNSPLAGGDMVLFPDENQKKILFSDLQFAKELDVDIQKVQKKQRSIIVEYGKAETGKWKLLLEILPPKIHLVIVGQNYDIYPLAEMASLLGWKITIVANPLKLNKNIFKVASVLAASDPNSKPVLDIFTSTVLMSHDYNTDLKNLDFYMSSCVGYIGLLGPKKRGNKLLEELTEREHRYSQKQIERVHTPTGLDIGGSSPEEISLSILAEIITFFQGREGGKLRYRKGTIYS